MCCTNSFEPPAHSRYPRDYLELVVFSYFAMELKAGRLLQSDWSINPRGTNIQAALHRARELLAKRPASNRQIILITDGQQNAGESAVEAAKILAVKKMPVFSLGTGSHIAPRDLAILRTIAPESVYHEDVLRGEVIIKEEVPANLPYKLTVKDGEKVVKEIPLISEGKPSRTVPFDFPVKELAAERLKAMPPDVKALGVAMDLKVSLSPIEGERELSNNSASLRIPTVS